MLALSTRRADKAEPFPAGAVAHERPPFPVEGHAPQPQQGLRTGNGSMHARPLHPVTNLQHFSWLDDRIPASSRIALYLSGAVMTVVRKPLARAPISRSQS